MKGCMDPTEREVVNHSRRVKKPKENLLVMTRDERRKRVGRMVHMKVEVEGE